MQMIGIQKRYSSKSLTVYKSSESLAAIFFIKHIVMNFESRFS